MPKCQKEIWTCGIARTFVTVSERGTAVYPLAALRLRIAQPDFVATNYRSRAGTRLLRLCWIVRGAGFFLTGEGEQLLAGCRVLLNYATALKEQAELLRSTWGPSSSLGGAS